MTFVCISKEKEERKCKGELSSSSVGRLSSKVRLEEFEKRRDDFTSDHFVGIELQNVKNENTVVVEILAEKLRD